MGKRRGKKGREKWRGSKKDAGEALQKEEDSIGQEKGEWRMKKRNIGPWCEGSMGMVCGRAVGVRYRIPC